jgi:HPt (histidine-containing phosphotransfer) domain-containing protein
MPDIKKLFQQDRVSLKKLGSVAQDHLVSAIRRVTGSAPDVLPAAGCLPWGEVPTLCVCWVRRDPQQATPDAARLLRQGLVLQVLDSVEALASHTASVADPVVLVLADLANATSAPLRALHAQAQDSTRMGRLAMVVLADTVTEADMLACLHAGAVDMVPMPYALDHLEAIARKHITTQGTWQVDVNNRLVAIDAQAAMERMQADVPFFGSLLRAFCDELPQRQQTLRNDWSLGPSQVMHHCHTLKGLALTMGLKSLAQMASLAETRAQHAARQGEVDPALLLQLEGEMQSARFHILHWLSLHPDCAATTP